MKKTILILSCAVLISCGSAPRDPIRVGSAVIGREADRRDKQQANHDELYRRMQEKKKRDQLADNARRVGEMQERNRDQNPRNWGDFSGNFRR